MVVASWLGPSADQSSTVQPSAPDSPSSVAPVPGSVVEEEFPPKPEEEEKAEAPQDVPEEGPSEAPEPSETEPAEESSEAGEEPRPGG